MVPYVKNRSAITIPCTKVVDLEIAFGTERMDQQIRLIQDILLRFGLARIVQIVDFGDFSGLPIFALEFKDMGFHSEYLRMIYFVAINGK